MHALALMQMLPMSENEQQMGLLAPQSLFSKQRSGPRAPQEPAWPEKRQAPFAEHWSSAMQTLAKSLKKQHDEPEPHSESAVHSSLSGKTSTGDVGAVLAVVRVGGSGRCVLEVDVVTVGSGSSAPPPPAGGGTKVGVFEGFEEVGCPGVAECAVGLGVNGDRVDVGALEGGGVETGLEVGFVVGDDVLGVVVTGGVLLALMFEGP